MIVSSLCIQLNDSKYSFVSQTIQFDSYLFAHCQRVLLLTIQFAISDLFALSLMSNSSIWTIDKTLLGVTTPGQTWEKWQWKDTLHFSKLQHYWNLTIRLFNVISGKLVSLGYLTHLQRWLLVYSTAPADWAFRIRHQSQDSIHQKFNHM